MGGVMADVRPTIKEQLTLAARCEKCSGYAFLARCLPNAFKRDGSEIRTYECVDCGHKMQRLAPGEKARA